MSAQTPTEWQRHFEQNPEAARQLFSNVPDDANDPTQAASTDNSSTQAFARPETQGGNNQDATTNRTSFSWAGSQSGADERRTGRTLEAPTASGSQRCTCQGSTHWCADYFSRPPNDRSPNRGGSFRRDATPTGGHDKAATSSAWEAMTGKQSSEGSEFHQGGKSA